MQYKYVYGITATWQKLSTWKGTCCNDTLSTKNPTWTGPLGVKLVLEGENVLCTIIPCGNI